MFLWKGLNFLMAKFHYEKWNEMKYILSSIIYIILQQFKVGRNL